MCVRGTKHCTPGYSLTLSCEWALTGSVGSGAAKVLVELEGAGSEQNVPSKTSCPVEGGEAEVSRFWEEGLGASHTRGADVEVGAGWQK